VNQELGVSRPMQFTSIASTFDRITASFIDSLVFLPIIFLDYSIEDLTQSQLLIFLYFVVSWQLGWLYTTLLHGYRGQTLGKIRRHIQVVQFADGSHISYRRAALRDLPYIVLILVSTSVWIYANIAWFGGWYSEEHNAIASKVYWAVLYSSLGWILVECVSMFFHPQRRAIHDLIAGTIVIRQLQKAY